MKSALRAIGRSLREQSNLLLMFAASVRCYVACFFCCIGKPAEFPFVIKGERFFVRKYTSDIFTLREVWLRNVYPDPPPGGIVVDLGANIGAYTVFAARRAKHVYAFEPLDVNFQQLKKNTRMLSNVTVFPYAIAASEGTRTITHDRIRLGCASIVTTKGRMKQDVRTIPLSRIFDLCRIPTIDLLKMDTEGAEHEILLSTPEEILRRIGAITMEFHDFLPTQHSSSLVRVLEKAGFSVTCHPHFCYRLYRTGSLQAIRQ